MKAEAKKSIKDLNAINNSEALRLKALEKRMDDMKKDVLRIVEQARKEKSEAKDGDKNEVSS